MNQVTTFSQLLSNLGLSEEIKSNIVIIFAILLLITMTITVFEKLGILGYFKILFRKNSPTEQELKALDELINFENNIDKDREKFPYADNANILKEIALLNRYFNSDIKDLYSLKYIFTRNDSHRALKLYSPIGSKIFLDKVNGAFVLKKNIKNWMIYTPAAIWVLIYNSAALWLYKGFFDTGIFLSHKLINVFYLLYPAILAIVIGMLTSPLILGLRSKKFSELSMRLKKRL